MKWKRIVSVVSHESQNGRREGEHLGRNGAKVLAGEKDSRGAKGEEGGRKGEELQGLNDQERS